MSSLDYLDLCRLCLVKDRVSVPIFEGEGDVRQIFLKIAACLPVKVGREDKLPKKICDDCVYKVELFYQFWNTTANAEKQLLQWLGDVSLDDKQGYVTGAHPSLMKPGQNPGENRLDGSVMQQVNDHPNNMGMGMLDSMGMGMPMMINTSGQQQPQQQMTSVPMDSGGVQTVQPVPGPSTQSSHDQRKTSTNQEDDEDESEEDDNSDDECDGDDGMAVKEESEEDPTSSRTIEPTTFVNVSLACDEAGPSGLQQQKIGEMPEMVMPPTDGDPKSGPTTLPISQEKKSGRRKKSVPASRAKESDKDKMAGSTAAAIKIKEEPLPSEQPSRLKAVRSKRKAEPVKTEENVPPKKRKLGRRLSAKAPIKRDLIFTSDSEDVDESSHDFWRNSDDDPPVRVEIKEVKKEVDDSSNDYWRDSDEDGGKPVELKTNTGYECSACEMTFTVRRKLNKHMLKHNHQKPYECPTCQKKFKYSVGLKNHIKSQHSEDAPCYTCEMCDFTTKQEHYLQEHFTRKHTEEYRYQCSLCGKHFKAERDYKAHMSNHDTGPQICDICGVTYPNKISLYSHKNYKHTEKDKPFECEICKKRLRTQKNLDNHMQHHNQTYVCEECGMKFARQTGLSKHRKIHREKSCLCPVCGKAFACMTTVRVHMITHSGDRPYICDVCGNSYTQRSSLMLHWRKKHPEASQPPPPVTLKNIPETMKADAD